MAAALFFGTAEAGVLENWASYLWKQDSQKPPTIKILVAHNKPGIVLEVKGKYKLFDPHKNEYMSTRFIGKRKFLQPLSNGLKWGEEFPGVYQIMIMPEDPNTTTLVDGIEYKGSIYVYDVGGQISVVNGIDVEDYLNSLLSTHYPQKLPEEMLGAIAITNRTEAYWQAKHPKTSYWDVDASRVGYEGYAVAGRPSTIPQALSTTKYMVLVNNNEPIEANWDRAAISLNEAEKMAKQGEHAAQILSKAFPNSTLRVFSN
jgi:stage II sporulation protein D